MPSTKAGTASTLAPRDRLLAAARQVLADDGVAGLGLRAIARRAGVSHGAPLRHFASLPDLLGALATEGFIQLQQAVDAAVASAGEQATAVLRLHAAGHGYLDAALADSGVFSIMFRPDLIEVGEECAAEGEAAFGQLVDLVVDAQEEGWQATADPTDAAIGMWALVHGLAELWLHGPIGTGDPGRLHDLYEVAAVTFINPGTCPRTSRRRNS